jgi:hypothetical protein
MLSSFSTPSSREVPWKTLPKNDPVFRDQIRPFDFRPTATQQHAADHWAKLMRDEFALTKKEAALEADFNRYVVQDILE